MKVLADFSPNRLFGIQFLFFLRVFFEVALIALLAPLMGDTDSRLSEIVMNAIRPFFGVPGKEELLSAMAVFGALHAILGYLFERKSHEYEVDLAKSFKIKMANALGMTGSRGLRDISISNVNNFISSEADALSKGVVAGSKGAVDLILILVNALFFAYYSPWILGLLICVGSLLGLIYLFHAKDINREIDQVFFLSQEINNRSIAFLARLKHLFLLQWDNKALSGLKRLFDEKAEAKMSVFSARAKIGLMYELIGALSLCGFIGLALAKGEDIASVVVIIALFYRTSPRIFELLKAWLKFKTGLRAYRSFLFEKEKCLGGLEDVEQERLDLKQISLKGFSVNVGDKKLLEAVDFDLVHGPAESVGIIGLSGEGKSSLLNALLGLNEPDEGELLVNGVAMEQKFVESFYSQISYVTQDSPIFELPLKDNIVLDKGFDSRWYERVLELCHLVQFSKGRSDKLSENNLSMGQKQRVLIARGLYRKPKFLFMDEATSNLDFIQEREIYKNILGIDGLTPIIISHRIGHLKDVKKFFIIHEGRLANEGTWSELAADEKSLIHTYLRSS